MLPQQFQQPPNKVNTFMEKAGWSALSTILGGVIVFFVTVWLVKIQVVNFSWFMLLVAFLMLVIAVFFAWYSIKTRNLLQEQYNKHIARIESDVQTFKNDHRRMREEETRHWNEWAVSFSAQADKEHRESTEELRRQCMEAIHDAELRLDVTVKNAQTQFSGALDSNKIVVGLYRDQLIHVQRQMKALEELLRKESVPESQE